MSHCPYLGKDKGNLQKLLNAFSGKGLNFSEPIKGVTVPQSKAPVSRSVPRSAKSTHEDNTHSEGKKCRKCCCRKQHCKEDNCLEDPFVNAEVDKALELGASSTAFIMPLIPEGFAFDSSNATTPSPPFLNTTEVGVWFSNTIPAKFEEDRANPVIPPLGFTLPASGPPFNLRGNENSPDASFQKKIADWGHKKWIGTSTFWIIPYLGQTFDTYQSTSIDNTIFLMNREDRGPDNYAKKIYMSALTCDKMQFYRARLDRGINNLYNQVAKFDKPVLSTWFDILLREVFLGLHFGDDDYPEYVVQYFSDFMFILSNLEDTEDNPERYQELIVKNTCLSPKIKEYIEKRRQHIIETEDKSNFIFWWNLAGMAPESLEFECVHNILAFVQYMSILFLLIRANIPVLGGYLRVDNSNVGLVMPPPNEDFFQKFKDAGTESEKLDVVRELYRLLLPNNLWASRVTKTQAQEDEASVNSEYTDLSVLIPLLVQVNNDQWNPATGDTNAGNYDTSRYAGFETTFSECDTSNVDIDSPADSYFPENLFVNSSIDNETLLPVTNEKFIPVFEKPLYCPFGLGYRRCPSEILNMLITYKIVDKFKDLEFEVRPPGLPPGALFAVPPPNSPLPFVVPLGPNTRAFNNLYAKNPQ